MKKKRISKKQFIQATGWLLYDEVANLDTYSTHDSESKVWNLPQEYLHIFQQNAHFMSHLSYTPEVPRDANITDELAGVYEIGFLTGYHIYLRERSLRTGGEHFTYTTDKEKIQEVTEWCFLILRKGRKERTWTEPALAAFKFAYDHALDNIPLELFRVKGHEFNPELFNIFFSQTFSMGYNFAHELIIPQIELDYDWEIFQHILNNKS